MPQSNPNNDPAAAPSPRDSFPNLYGWLQIAPLEQRREEISRAIERLRRKFPRNSPSEELDVRRAHKVIELAEKHLLNEPLKQAYDRKWTQHFASKSSESTAVTVASATVEANPRIVDIEKNGLPLDGLLPAGDPSEPFDLPAFQTSTAAVRIPSPDAEYQRLQKVLQESRNNSTVLAAQSAPVGVLNSTLSDHVTESLSGQRLSRRKQRKHRAPWVSVLAILAGIGVLLGLGFVLLTPPVTPADTALEMASKSASTQSSEKSRDASDVPSLNSNSTSAVRTPRAGSGLPKPGEGGAGGFGVNLETLLPAVEERVAKPEPALTTSNVVLPSAVPSTMIAERPSIGLPDREMPTNTDMAKAANAGQVAASSANLSEGTPSVSIAPASNAEAKLSRGEQEDWGKAMSSVRKLIGNLAFDEADKKLKEIAGQAKTSLQLAQHRRLAAIKNLASQFHSALADAIKGLSPGEMVKVGTSTHAAFVASSPTTITVKVAGENRRYSFDQIPIGLAYALVDLKLDTAQPQTLACKAAFAFTHPKSNQTFFERGRQMMLEAAQANAVDRDLPLAFDDLHEIDN